MAALPLEKWASLPLKQTLVERYRWLDAVRMVVIGVGERSKDVVGFPLSSRRRWNVDDELNDGDELCGAQV